MSVNSIYGLNLNFLPNFLSVPSPQLKRKILLRPLSSRETEPSGPPAFNACQYQAPPSNIILVCFIFFDLNFFLGVIFMCILSIHIDLMLIFIRNWMLLKFPTLVKNILFMFKISIVANLGIHSPMLLNCSNSNHRHITNYPSQPSPGDVVYTLFTYLQLQN